MGRVGLYIGNQAIVERYVGDKLVWIKSSTQKFTFQNVPTRLKDKLTSTDIVFKLSVLNNNIFKNKKLVKISINNSTEINVEGESQLLEITDNNVIIQRCSDTLIQYFINHDVRDFLYRKITVTFYLKE